MIFDAGSLLRVVTSLAEEEGVPVPVSLGILRAIVMEAERLAAGRIEDEPAALFYTSARRAHLFAKTARPFLEGFMKPNVMFMAGLMASLAGCSSNAPGPDATPGADAGVTQLTWLQ